MECKIGHCHCVILTPALLASLEILGSLIKVKNVLDLELFTQSGSCSKVTELWLEEIAWRPPPRNWRHTSLSCCCDMSGAAFWFVKWWRFQRDLSVSLCWMVGLILHSHFVQRSKIHRAETFLFKTTGCLPIARLTSGRTSIGFLPRAKRYVSFWQFESKWLIVVKHRGAALDIFETVDTV